MRRWCPFLLASLVLLASCASPLGLPEGYRTQSYARPGETVSLAPTPQPSKFVEPPLLDLGLEQAQDIGLQRNHGAKAASAAVDAAIAAISQARAAYLPTLDTALQKTYRRKAAIVNAGPASFVISPAEQINAQATLSLSLFSWGRNRLNLEAARLDATTEAFAERAVRQELAFRIAQAWYGIHEAESNVRVATDALASSKRQVEDASNLLDAGRATKDQLLTARVNELTNQQLLLVAQNQVKQTRRVLNTLLARPVDAELSLAPAPEFQAFPAAAPRLRALGHAHNPQMLAFRSRREALDRRRQAMIRSWMPEAVAQGQFTYSDFVGATGFQTNKTATFGLNWRPLDAGRRLGQIEQFKALLVQLSHQEREAHLQLDVDLENGVQQLEELASQVRVALQSIEAADENYRIVSDRFRAGRTTSREVLEAETTRSQSLFSYNQARFQYMVVLHQLELLSGVERENWSAEFAPAGAPAQGAESEAATAAEAPAATNG